MPFLNENEKHSPIVASLLQLCGYCRLILINFVFFYCALLFLRRLRVLLLYNNNTRVK